MQTLRTSVYRITYSSYASRLFNRDTLSVLTAVSRRNNANLGVTGMLVFHNRRFFQVLEGAEEDLTQLMMRIASDPRHRGLTMIEHGPVDKRAFTTWRVFCSDRDMQMLEAPGTVALGELIPVDSDLRGNDPHVRRQVRRFLAELRDLPKAAVG